MLEGLIVDAGRMRRNLDLTGGLIVAEAVMMALAEHTGPAGRARPRLRRLPRRPRQGVHAAGRAGARPDVTRHLDAKRLAELTDPVNYLGSAAGHGRSRAGLAQHVTQEFAAAKIVASRSSEAMTQHRGNCKLRWVFASLDPTYDLL